MTKYNPIPLFDGDKGRQVSLSSFTWFEDYLSCLSFDWKAEYKEACRFLNEIQNRNTYRAYRADIESLFNYCWFERQSSVLNLRSTDVSDYIRFLDSPPVMWEGDAVKYRFKNGDPVDGANELWRPISFTRRSNEKIGSKNSKIVAFGSLSSFYRYLCEQAELIEHNPFLTARKRNIGRVNYAENIVGRIMSDLQLNYLWKACDSLGEDFKSARARFIISLLINLGVRGSEISTKTINEANVIHPTMSRFKKLLDGWVYFVPEDVGKGGKSRFIPVSDMMLDELKRYRRSYSEFINAAMPALPSVDDNHPILPHLNLKPGGLTNRAIANEVKRLLSYAKELMEAESQELLKTGSTHEAEELTRESANMLELSQHWFRHKYATEDLKHGGNVKFTQLNLGHTSMSTTSIYIHDDMSERLRAANKKK